MKLYDATVETYNPLKDRFNIGQDKNPLRYCYVETHLNLTLDQHRMYVYYDVISTDKVTCSCSLTDK